MFPDFPQTPEIKLNSTLSFDTLTNTKTVKIICKSATGFAAPLYYQPDLNYTWLLPVPVDSPGFTVKKSVRIILFKSPLTAIRRHHCQCIVELWKTVCGPPVQDGIHTSTVVQVS